MMNNTRIRLSSDYLYTYTSEIDTIKKILKYGFRYRLNKEKLPYRNSEQQNYIVCFYDILPEHSGYHRTVYGRYGLALTKKWGILNGIAPIRYIHEKSIGASKTYYQMKNDMREAKSILQNGGNVIDYICAIVLHSIAREKEILTSDSIVDDLGKDSMMSLISHVDEELEEHRKKFGDEDLVYFFNAWVHPILRMLEKSHDELERRDAFLRMYKADFREEKGKKLYDEREWRSVKFISDKDIAADPLLLENAKSNEYLPESFNLKYEVSDLVSILVDNEVEKAAMKQYLIAEHGHLNGIQEKVQTFSEHMQENNSEPNIIDF